MFDTIDITSQATTANILAGTLNLPFPDASPSASVEFDFPEFDYSFNAPLIDLTYTPDSRRVTARVAIDESVTMVWMLNGEPSPEGGKMLLKEATVDFEMESGRPRAEFVADTVNALLWLAGPMRLRIPGVRLDGHLNFEAPLKKASELLRHRHTAYRLMVIGSAFEQEIPIPVEISDSDWQEIAFAYHAIVDRSFEWAFMRERFPIQDKVEAQKLWENGENPFHFHLELDDFRLKLPGRQLSAGRATIDIEQARILNAAEIRRKLEGSNGRGHQAFMFALTGVAECEFHDAPRLPEMESDKRLAEFIDLKAPLDERVCRAYDQLAASTLDGLDEEQIAAVTAPLDFEPFPMSDDEEEN
jgi:hypothetical protein